MDKEIDVRFTVETYYENLGRNRYSRATGIRIEPVKWNNNGVDKCDEVHMFGLGSKGTPTAGIRLVVPRADLAALRDALNEVLAETVPEAVLRAMEDEPSPLPEAVAAAWDAA